MNTPHFDATNAGRRGSGELGNAERETRADAANDLARERVELTGVAQPSERHGELVACHPCHRVGFSGKRSLFVPAVHGRPGKEPDTSAIRDRSLHPKRRELRSKRPRGHLAAPFAVSLKDTP